MYWWEWSLSPCSCSWYSQGSPAIFCFITKCKWQCDCWSQSHSVQLKDNIIRGHKVLFTVKLEYKCFKSFSLQLETMFLEFSTFKWNSWEIKVWNSDASVALRKYIHDKSSQRELDVGATIYPLGKCGFSSMKENCEMALMLSLSALTQRQFIFLTENHFNKIIMFLSNILETFGHLVQSENCWPDLNMFPQQKFDNIISLDSAQPRELKYF